MGLLDQILGGLAGDGGERPPMGQGSSGGMSSVLMAMLPVVLSMLANRQSVGMADAASSQFGGRGAAGTGLGGLGGLGGLLEQLTRSGYGQQANSWVSTGPNEPLQPQAWSDILGRSQLSAIAAQAGVSEDQARAGLSELVPDVVDRLTPEGHMPEQDQLLASIEAFARQAPR